MIKNKNLKKMILTIIFSLLTFFSLIPIIYAIKVSFDSGNNLLSSELTLLPKSFTAQNYKNVLFELPFLLWLKNSLIISLLTVILTLIVIVPSAYAFSRFVFKGKRVTIYALILLNAFPTILSMFATYNILKYLGLLNTYIGLAIVYTGQMSITGILIMKGYFDGIPLEIEESAKVDGVNTRQLLTKIIFPLARPGVIVTAVMVLIYVWNEYVYSVLFMNGADKYTLAAGLYSLQATEYTRNWPLFSAASILVSIPVLIIFYRVQKQMISGLMSGGVKG